MILTPTLCIFTKPRGAEIPSCCAVSCTVYRTGEATCLRGRREESAESRPCKERRPGFHHGIYTRNAVKRAGLYTPHHCHASCGRNSLYDSPHF